jgi:hypothetical protein
MDYPLLMRMLNRVAHLNKQLQPRAGPKGTLVAEIGDLNALDEFHYEIRPSTLGRARIEYVSDVRMVHQRKRLSFGLKARNLAFRVHSRLNQLEGDTPVDWFLLFRDKNDSATSFSDWLAEFVPTDTVTRLLPGSGFGPLFAYLRCRRLFQESSDAVIRLEQRLYLAAEILVVGAGTVQKSATLRCRKLNGFRKEFNVASRVHAS